MIAFCKGEAYLIENDEDSSEDNTEEAINFLY